MMTPTEAKILATLELIHESLTELVTAFNELIAVEKTITKRQGAKNESTKEIFKVFAEDMKSVIQEVFTPQPLPEQAYLTQPMPVKPLTTKHEVKIIHIHDYDNDRPQLEIDINELLANKAGSKLLGGNWILAGMTDYVIMFHRVVEVEEVDAEFFTDDEGKVNVQ